MAETRDSLPRPLRCLACAADDWVRLPDPGPASMASDWRVVADPLEKMACRRCGLAVRRTTPAAQEALFDGRYELYAHAPGGAFERSRQAQYASWIAGLVDRPPARVLDVGCGNGSLLTALAAIWPRAELLGCDASARSVAYGAAAGLRLWHGTSATLDAGIQADLVLAVNVIEHTADPVQFLGDLRRASAPGAMVIIICPDGSSPGVELLIADHLFSFTPRHLRGLLARVGLRVRQLGVAPASLGAFHLAAAGPDDPHAGGASDVESEPVADDLNGRRGAYLRAWQALDRRLLERLPAQVVTFGAGEAAGLLRAYAPLSWTRVEACTTDAPSGQPFGGIPFTALDSLPSDTSLLIAVRPADQERVAGRLRGRFSSVTTWYDLLPS